MYYITSTVHVCFVSDTDMEAKCKVEPRELTQPKLEIDIAEEPLEYQRKSRIALSGKFLVVFLVTFIFYIVF